MHKRHLELIHYIVGEESTTDKRIPAVDPGSTAGRIKGRVPSMREGEPSIEIQEKLIQV